MTVTDPTNVPVPGLLLKHSGSRVTGGYRYTVAVGPNVRGEANVLADARKAAARQITTLLELYRTPKVLTYGGNTVVLFASTNGVDTVTDTGCVSSGRDNWETAEAAARYHLVQIGTDPHDDESVRDAIFFLRPLSEHHEGCRYTPEDLIDWSGFQRAYRVAEARGENDPHTWAHEHRREHLPCL